MGMGQCETCRNGDKYARLRTEGSGVGKALTED